MSPHLFHHLTLDANDTPGPACSGRRRRVAVVVALIVSIIASAVGWRAGATIDSAPPVFVASVQTAAPAPGDQGRGDSRNGRRTAPSAGADPDPRSERNRLRPPAVHDDSAGVDRGDGDVDLVAASGSIDGARHAGARFAVRGRAFERRRWIGPQAARAPPRA